MRYNELDTPALLIDRDRLEANLKEMQAYADEHHVKLRPHTKTHKMPDIAKLQLEHGACGIAVAKVGEAEEMAAQGIKNIFIANEIVGKNKLERICKLASSGVEISFGVDSVCHITAAEEVFAARQVFVPVLVEIEVGENRSGIIEEDDFIKLLEALKKCSHVKFGGIFSHDGNSYEAEDIDQLEEIAQGAQERTLNFVKLAEEQGMKCATVSYGATPTFMNHVKILAGITELRPGTYALMDASQGHAVGTLDKCAATVLATVISKPTSQRTILDVGAKGLTMQRRTVGICATPGLGTIFDDTDVHIDSVFDEHAILYDQPFHDRVNIGDKVRIIPVHICPVCNLHETAYLISGDEVLKEMKVSCRGKLK
ncbi:MAG: alanine racemase [Anaerovibrio sp.]|uniref:alanine racemase n=1 Tax=Anaerovibrio sp. TaxID=1872532 RepID=UPI0025E76D3F|nr:alanine racemase [Anaerovibrio sp.]MCR5177002.1 alanine racemase [Anaerovibrio sp.]